MAKKADGGKQKRSDLVYKYVHCCIIFIILVLSYTPMTDLEQLIKTDTGGNLESHAFLAAYHGFDVAEEGIVTIDGERYEIWHEVRRIV